LQILFLSKPIIEIICSLIDQYVKKQSGHGTSTFNESNVASRLLGAVTILLNWAPINVMPPELIFPNIYAMLTFKQLWKLTFGYTSFINSLNFFKFFIQIVDVIYVVCPFIFISAKIKKKGI
jgi:hypothetical protein